MTITKSTKSYIIDTIYLYVEVQMKLDHITNTV